MITYLAYMPVLHMVLNYKGRHVIDNWTDIDYLQYVQSSWSLRTPSMLRTGYPTLLHWRCVCGGGGGYDLYYT